jgi:hypothetical protein
MAVALTVVGAAIALGEVSLIVVCWRRRAVLGGVLGVGGIALVAFAIASGPTADFAEGALGVALALLIVGVVLYGLGQRFERLLDDEPDEAA